MKVEEGSREEAGGGMAVVVVGTMTVHRTSSSSSILGHLYQLNKDQGEGSHGSRRGKNSTANP